MKTNLVLAALCASLVAGCKTPAPPPAVQPPATTLRAAVPAPTEIESNRYVIYAPDASCKITIDTTRATNLTDWAQHKLAPVLAEWYPKICAIIPTPGYKPPTNWTVTIAPGRGVAATGGRGVTANATWFQNEIAPGKQGIGALVHEEVHVVQQYGSARITNAPASLSFFDITNLVSLVQKLKDKADPVSAFLTIAMTSAERKALAAYRGAGRTDYKTRTNVVAALNRIIGGAALYDAALFKGVTLRDSTASLREQKPEGDDLARLNRALLEDAYPGELARSAAPGGGRRGGGGGNTGWLTEGIPDYIRWFLYEPKAHGADMVYFQAQSNRAARGGPAFQPRYDGSYRITANFLNFVTHKYDPGIVTKLSDALRQRKYSPAIWVDNTGKTVQQLNEEWLAVVHKEIKTKPAASAAPAKS